jgi:DNA-binding beta-propeller fold protein YncE
MLPIRALTPLLLLAVSCSVPDLDTFGRRCGTVAPCGPGARCDTTRNICVATSPISDGSVNCTTVLEGIALGPQGKAVYVIDQMNHNIRKIEAGNVTTVAGNGKGYKDGPVATAKFETLRGVVVDKAGAVYVSDNSPKVLRKISGGVVSTVAGVGTPGYLNGEALKAAFTGVWGLARDASGLIYVSDGIGQYIRKYQP